MTTTTQRDSERPLDFFWFIPTHGDGRYLGSERQQRPPEFAYFKEIAQAVDRLGFPGVLLPTGQSCEDSWITATGLAAHTERLKFLVDTKARSQMVSFRARLNLPPFAIATQSPLFAHDPAPSYAPTSAC